ncbi:hypothetical protein V2J09_004329, partial [Rumex salicifolius]
ARLGERKVIVLVDSGASHNFINCRIVEVEELTVESTSTFGVRLGNGQKVETQGICWRLSLLFGSCEMAVDCYPFDLGRIDLVLGYAWLLSIKRMTVDWEALTVEFEQEGRKVLIQGDPTLAMTVVSFNFIQKLGQVEFGALIWETRIESEGCSLTVMADELAVDLHSVLADFEEVLGEITELPLKRFVDNLIVLKEGVSAQRQGGTGVLGPDRLLSEIHTRIRQDRHDTVRAHGARIM